MKKENKIYKVNLIKKAELKITGKGGSAAWEKSEVLTQFLSPWDTKEPSKIEFRALWDGEYFFFCFTVFDTKIHIDTKDNSVDSIGNSDRVELFFRPNDSLNPYYCLEIDATARIMDFIAYPDKKFNFNWDWPKNHITVYSSRNDESFIVEGAISLDSLNQFNLINENKMETGVFRAKYNSEDGINFEPTWISWVDPNTETPNFHISSSFGVFHLMP
ncbi:MAG: hypothetical protein RIR01_1089 [Bacteroidota bacterium]|jgi:hypothetical protein